MPAPKRSHKSLLAELERWLNKPLSQIPPELHERIEDAFFPFGWDQFEAHQRRAFLIQHDASEDPRFELERQAGFNLGVKRHDLRQQIKTWETVNVTNAREAALKEDRLKQLHAELRRLDPPRNKERRSGGLPAGYVAYPKAAAILLEKLDATPEEIAAWIWFTPQQGGIAAYQSANELSPPPRFFYDVLLHADGDYIAPLMGCWFERKEINRFKPGDRFLTGRWLIDRWAGKVSNPRAFIEAKIKESRLNSLHPIFGSTREMFENDAAFPPLEMGLFAHSEVERIEAEDFPAGARTNVAKVGSPQWRRDTARKAADAKHDKPGGSREKRAAIRAAWASGKYDSRDRCAEEEGRAHGMSFSAARKALIGAPEPKRKSRPLRSNG